MYSHKQQNPNPEKKMLELWLAEMRRGKRGTRGREAEGTDFQLPDK